MKTDLEPEMFKVKDELTKLKRDRKKRELEVKDPEDEEWVAKLARSWRTEMERRAEEKIAVDRKARKEKQREEEQMKKERAERAEEKTA